VGSLNSELGISAICGGYTRESQSKFRISLGPMKYDRFVRFFPTGDMLRPIFSLTRFMVGVEHEFEVRPVLSREEVPLCTIGVEGPTAPRLGWSTWLKAPGVSLAEDRHVTFRKQTSTSDSTCACCTPAFFRPHSVAACGEVSQIPISNTQIPNNL